MSVLAMTGMPAISVNCLLMPPPIRLALPAATTTQLTEAPLTEAALTEDADGWVFRALAGAGIVADSDPAAEREETEAKIAALRRALTAPA